MWMFGGLLSSLKMKRQNLKKSFLKTTYEKRLVYKNVLDASPSVKEKARKIDVLGVHCAQEKTRKRSTFAGFAYMNGKDLSQITRAVGVHFSIYQHVFFFS